MRLPIFNEIEFVAGHKKIFKILILKPIKARFFLDGNIENMLYVNLVNVEDICLL
jgi:hypothetical protein